MDSCTRRPCDDFGGVICRITDGYVIAKKGGRHERGEDAERCTTLRANGLGVFRVVRPKRRDNSEGTIGNAAILHDESRNELYNGSKRGDNTRCVAIGREQHTEELATGELGVRNCGSLCTLQHLCLSENHIGYKRKNGNEGEIQLHLERLARIGIVDGRGVVAA
ncbi:MAG: hypothetical protein K2G69_04395 [Muribaculaceae bacterium]|nr:hypothetical protein [Muribaculaceae bacterium]